MEVSQKVISLMTKLETVDLIFIDGVMVTTVSVSHCDNLYDEEGLPSNTELVMLSWEYDKQNWSVYIDLGGLTDAKIDGNTISLIDCDETETVLELFDKVKSKIDLDIP